MNRPMRSTFEALLKINEVRYVSIYQGLLALRREKIREGLTSGRIDCRVLTADPVRRGVHKGEVVSECAGGNLIIIVGVTPTADSAVGIWIPESAVLKIRCICNEGN